VPPSLAQRQASSAPEALLDTMTAHWVMTGTIGRPGQARKIVVVREVDADAEEVATCKQARH
jgi:hypothetical protein